MATGRLAIVLKSRSEFSDEEIACMTEDDAWQWIYANVEPSQADRPVEDRAETRH